MQPDVTPSMALHGVGRRYASEALVAEGTKEETKEEEEELEFVCCVFGGFQARELAFWQSGASLHHLQ